MHHYDIVLLKKLILSSIIKVGDIQVASCNIQRLKFNNCEYTQKLGLRYKVLGICETVKSPSVGYVQFNAKI